MTKDNIKKATSKFIYGIGQISVDTDGIISYYKLDELGSISQIYDATGNVKTTINYDEFGNIANPEDVSTGGNIFSYTGHVYDSSTGLYYAKARYYDASVGRFISEDSCRGNVSNPKSLNFYIYTQNNPIINIDPTGYMPVTLLRGISKYYNLGSLDDDMVSFFTLAANGLGVYTALHEIAQLNIAKKLAGRGRSSILEYKITSKVEKTIWGNPRKYEADVVSGNQVWEVKPKGTSGTKQLKKYIEDGNLQEGVILPDIYDIPVYEEYSMDIKFDQPGIAHYSLHKKNKKGIKVPVTNAEFRKEYYKDVVEIVGATSIATAIISATLVEDVATGGAGILDDPASFAFAFKIIEKAFAN